MESTSSTGWISAGYQYTDPCCYWSSGDQNGQHVVQASSAPRMGQQSVQHYPDDAAAASLTFNGYYQSRFTGGKQRLAFITCVCCLLFVAFVVCCLLFILRLLLAFVVYYLLRLLFVVYFAFITCVCCNRTHSFINSYNIFVHSSGEGVLFIILFIGVNVF